MAPDFQKKPSKKEMNFGTRFGKGLERVGKGLEKDGKGKEASRGFGARAAGFTPPLGGRLHWKATPFALTV